MDELNNLVFYHSLNEPAYTTVDVIAEYAGVQRESVNRLIQTHNADLEEFGILRFEIAKLNGRGRPRKNWQLNEQQVTFLFSLLDNTPQVVRFNKALTKAFYEVKERAQQLEIDNARQQERLASLTVTNKVLSEVVHDKFPDNKFMYSTIHNLALKVATGKNAKQLKAEFGVSDAKDALTAEQVSDLEHVREAIKALLLIGKSYEEVKEALA
ncbi:MAG TPA: Rha family transcriptional regulator [Weissella cibaria]|nr:Rha family transcriptional regulator [Weissella cibaria]